MMVWQVVIIAKRPPHIRFQEQVTIVLLYLKMHMNKCQICQVNANRERRLAFPLQPVTVENPFEQWGLDVVGEINLNSLKLHKYILTAIDYFSKWTKAIPLKVINKTEVTQFLKWNIVTRFGVCNCLVFDSAKYFSSLKIV